MKKKTALIRIDKIGDLVATLPVDQAACLAGRDVLWVVNENVRFLCELAEPRRQSLSLSSGSGWSAFTQMRKIFRDTAFDEVIVFYAPWWVSLAAWLAKIPMRAGRLSQWHSFLFFNRGLRQSRSNSEMHEADYNWELLHFALEQKKPSRDLPFLHIKAPQHRQLLEKLHLSLANFVVVHPGMAGSALNWPQTHYNKLIETLVETTTVVITGTAADGPWLTSLEPLWKNHPRVRWVVGQLKIEELIYLLQSAKNVVAPSTGILHIAVSAGTQSVGIYSPVKAHHPKRWGPRGLGVTVLTPDVNCPAKISCLTDQCPEHPCMKTISVEQVLKGLQL